MWKKIKSWTRFNCERWSYLKKQSKNEVLETLKRRFCFWYKRVCCCCCCYKSKRKKGFEENVRKKFIFVGAKERKEKKGRLWFYKPSISRTGRTSFGFLVGVLMKLLLFVFFIHFSKSNIFFFSFFVSETLNLTDKYRYYCIKCFI
jgi:hypothetical protein